MASLQCNKPAAACSQSQGQHQINQKHDQQDHHCFGHVSDKIKGVFKGHLHGQAPPGAAAHNSAAVQCKPAPKKREQHKNKEGGLLHKIKEAFSDDSSSSSDSDNEDHKPHPKRKN